MTNKSITIGIMSILVAGLIFLGLEVKDLRADVSRLSTTPAQATSRQQVTGPKSTRPDVWQPSSNNRWDPYAELAQIQSQMNRLFNESFSGGLWHQGIPGRDTHNLRTDINDTKDKYVIDMDIPGMEKENINVEVKNNTLLVSGERNKENEEKNGNYYRQERSFGYFSQSLPLPEDADSSGIAVNYNHGVLKIEIPKLAKAEAQQQKPVKIKVN